MAMYEVSGGRLDVISEEAEHQDSPTTTMDHHTVAPEGRGRGVSLQRFSVDTNESLRFEPYQGSTPSPTGADDGLDEDDDDVFKEGETQVGVTTTVCIETKIKLF